MPAAKAASRSAAATLAVTATSGKGLARLSLPSSARIARAHSNPLFFGILTSSRARSSGGAVPAKLALTRCIASRPSRAQKAVQPKRSSVRVTSRALISLSSATSTVRPAPTARSGACEGCPAPPVMACACGKPAPSRS
ncbi:hypothetical protein D3C87_1793840 [compost metagenome]